MNATCAAAVAHRRGDPLFMTSLARGLSVIRALLETGPRQTIAELSRATGLHRAVVRRCLYTLGELGYAYKEGRAYSLGPQFAGLEQRLRTPATGIARAAQPVLESLSRRLGESSAVAVLESGNVIYLACVAPDGATVLPSAAGPPMSACRTAPGRVLLASLSQRQAALEHPGLETASELPLPVSASGGLQELVSRVRTQGYALTEHAGEARVRSLAVPVRNALGATVAAMEVAVRSAQVSRADLIDRYLPLLKTAAVALGRGLQPAI